MRSEKRLSVLIIDDEPSVARAASRLLHSMGFETMVATGGDDAIDICRTRAEDDASVLHNRPWLEDRFPKLRFLGPLPFVSSEFERERTLALHLAELLQA